MHTLCLSFCGGDECTRYADECLARVSAERHGAVWWSTEPMSRDAFGDLARARIYAGIKQDETAACAECGQWSWVISATKQHTNSLCSRCARVWYCSTKCQRAHRAAHRAQCVHSARLDARDPVVVGLLEWERRHAPRADASADEAARLFRRRSEAGVCARRQCRVRLEAECALQKPVELANIGGATVTFCTVRCAELAMSKLLANGTDVVVASEEQIATAQK